MIGLLQFNILFFFLKISYVGIYQHLQQVPRIIILLSTTIRMTQYSVLLSIPIPIHSQFFYKTYIEY